MLFAAAALAAAQAAPAARIEAALVAGEPALRQLFANPADADALIEMAQREGGLAAQRPLVGPGPDGRTWTVFTRFREIQQDWDHAHPMLPDGRLGPARPISASGGWRIEGAQVEARFYPEESRVGVTARLQIEPGSGPLVMRLGSQFRVRRARWNGNPAQFARLGSLLWTPGRAAGGELEVTYDGVVNTAGHDLITADIAHVTAWWLPTINRLPHPIETTLTGPEDWELWAEGDAVSDTRQDGLRTIRRRCSIPISFPKLMGGKYTLAGEQSLGGITLKSWQRDPLQPERAGRDLQRLAEGMAFFSERLGPFPFDRYEVIDAETYYGIESYTHTLLRRNITTRFATHELLHTWLGGLAPCAYSQDTWNEGFTQYIDSVLFQGNSDRTLEQGFRARSAAVPLSAMPVAWANGNASYMRGAYTARMLHQEIGDDAFWKAMKALCRDARGQDLTWPALRPFFEQASGRDLAWFWRQWVTGAQWPTLTAEAAADGPGRWRVRVTQSGTPTPFRLKIGWPGQDKPVVMDQLMQEFLVESDAEPTPALFPHTLARGAWER
jgi:hypothetical protein